MNARVIFVMSVLFWWPTVTCYASDYFIRAVLPNPVGSDTQEWILLEKSPTASNVATLVVKDGLGAVQSYEKQVSFSYDNLASLPRSESGLSLNNDADWVELWQSGAIIDQSGLFENLSEGFVWTRLATHWLALSAQDFERRLEDHDWEEESDNQKENDQDEDNNAEDEPNEKPHEEPNETQKSLASNHGAVTPESVAPEQQTDQSILQSPSTPEVQYQQWLIIPQLAAPLLATRSASITPRSPPAYPQIEGESERQQFELWRQKAILGGFGFLFSGMCFVIVALPPVCHWYNERQCIW